MQYDNTVFFNTYLKVLRNKFESTMNDCMNLESQLILANETIQEQQKQIEDLQKNINKLEKKS